MTQEAIKPCPFCHHADIRTMIGIGNGDRGYSMLCGGCGIRQGSAGRTEAEAIAAWNQRTPSPTMQATIDELVEALAFWELRGLPDKYLDDARWAEKTRALIAKHKGAGQ